MAIPEDERLINAADTKVMTGNISDMTLWRWQRNKKLGFPAPLIINNRRYWPLGAIKDFIKRRTTE